MEHIGSSKIQGTATMPKVKKSFFLAFYTFLSLILNEKTVAATNYEKHGTARSDYSSTVYTGVLLDLSSPMDNMIHVCLSMALSDFYTAHPYYKTRLVLHTKNVEEELEADFAVLEMVKRGEVHGVLGPQWSKEPTFVVELGASAHVPVISFTAKSRAFSHSQSPYFVRTTPDDLFQAKGLAAICKGFEWLEIVVLYEDTEYGSLFVSKLNKAFQEVDIKLASIIAISTSTKANEIAKELNNLTAKQTRVFLVHMNIMLGQRLFVQARRAGMMSKGYAWLISDSLSNFLASVDSSSMENVLGIRPHVPKSKSLDNFRAKWKKSAHFMKPASSVMELNVYGFWAYDTIWGLAMAIEKVMPSITDFLDSSQRRNGSKIPSIKVSRFGQRILTELLKTKFTGLAGEFQLVDGQLQPSAFEIFNVIGTGDRTVGFWSPDRGITKKVSAGVDPTPTYSNSTKELRAIMWPGDTLVAPVGWAIPASGKLKVGVPKKNGFTEFVNVQEDSSTQQYNFSGYSIDVFLAALKLLPFQLDYEFVPYLNTSKDHNGSYNEMLHKIHDKTYDFVVGDVTILANRSTFVDFTLPYTGSGVVMVLKNKKSRDMWIFLKPLSWDLWLTIGLTCIFMGGVLGILEHQRHSNDTNALRPHEQKLRVFFWLPIAVLAFPERNMVANKWSMFVMVVWLLVAYILMQSYTAKLSSIFTVEQLNFALTPDCNVGYQHGSFVKDFLINELCLNETKLKGYTTIQEYHDAMRLGSKKGGIDAIYAEIPYMRILLNRYTSEYRIVGPTHKTDGFGFAFPMGSPLVSYFSRAILNVTQGPTMAEIEQKNFGPGYASDGVGSINQENPSLTAYNFGGLFIIVISATMLALFCSKTSVGQSFTTMVSNYGHRCLNFLINGGNGAKVHSSFHGDASEASSQPSEEANNSEVILDSESNVSARQGEVAGSNRTTSNVVNVSSETREIQLSDISHVDASGGLSGIPQPQPNVPPTQPQ